MTGELVLIVRRPPGRAHLHRYRASRLTVGRDSSCNLVLDDPSLEPIEVTLMAEADGFSIVSETDRTRLGGRALAAGEAHRIDAADAIEIGSWLIEIDLDGGAAPITDRQERRRLERALSAERTVRAVGGPSLWVLRGERAGAAMPFGLDGLTCGAGTHDLLHLSDPGVEPAHFRVWCEPDGAVRLEAQGPVKVRGRAVREVDLQPGDLVFVGQAICELRVPGIGGEPPERSDRRTEAVASGPPALALVLFGAAIIALVGAWIGWWLETRGG